MINYFKRSLFIVGFLFSVGPMLAVENGEKKKQAKKVCIYNAQDCGICFEALTREDKSQNILFGGVSKHPTLLDCGHLSCSDCLFYWWHSQSEGRDKCPQCRQQYSLPQNICYEESLFEKKFGINWYSSFIGYAKKALPNISSAELICTLPAIGCLIYLISIA